MPDHGPADAASPSVARHRYTLPVARDEAEVVTAELWAAGAVGIWEQPGRLVAWFTERRIDELPPGGWFSDEPDRDWQAEWKATIAPVRAGRFCVVPTWVVADHQPEEGEVTLVLDPGRAFGSGHHATTALCLELIDGLSLEAREPGDLRGVDVADVGCGSGVLAIAAAARGGHVVATDVDPDAVAVTSENVQRNAVTVASRVGSVAAAVDLLGGRAQLVLANLVTDTLAELAAELVGALRANGTLIASGIAADRAEAATGPLEAAGLRIEERRERDGWVALRGRRTAASRSRRAAPSGTDAAPAGPTTGVPGGAGRST